VIVASLAIGIGANTAVFSVVNALLLKTAAIPGPDRLAVLWLRRPASTSAGLAVAGTIHRRQERERSFSEMSISQGRSGTIIGRAEKRPSPNRNELSVS
jgi:hypothetical protein